MSGRPWQTAVGGELNVSEMIHYSVYVEYVLGLPAFTSDDMLCHTHWGEDAPMDEPALRTFLNGLRPDDNAVMISAKSGTPLAVWRAVIASRSTAAQ